MFWSNEKVLNEGLIEYVEKEAKTLMNAQAENRVVLERSRDVLLNILLAGAGGSLALAVSLFSKNANGWLFYGMTSTSVYLFLLSALLIIGHKRGQYIIPLGNQPDNLYNDVYKNMHVMYFKELYLQTMQQVIDNNRQNNSELGEWLDRIRLMAAATPALFVAAFLFEILA